MKNYLSYKFEDTPAFVSTYDELPLWSASFGQLLLKYIDYTTNITIVDIGTGTGFPLLEIASRFGASCTCYGVDIWTNAINRVAEKVKNYGLTNVEMIETSAAEIPLADNSVDLIVSNLGINNFEDPTAVFAECYRLLKPGGKLALTTNLYGHWQEFYSVFEETLAQLDMHELLPELKKQQLRRGTIDTTKALFEQSGFRITKEITDSFEMKFADGSAFLDHHFVKLGWLGSWTSLVPKEQHEKVFGQLEQNLNSLAQKQGGLTLTVPMAFIEGAK